MHCKLRWLCHYQGPLSPESAKAAASGLCIIEGNYVSVLNHLVSSILEGLWSSWFHRKCFFLAKKSMPTYKVKENLYTSFARSKNLANRSMYKLGENEAGNFSSNCTDIYEQINCITEVNKHCLISIAIK